jgi:serine protease Do
MPGAFLLALTLAVAGVAGQARADVNADIEALVRASKARAAIVKRVSPAVVHISVEKTVRGQASPAPFPDMFDDEFFRRFFQPRMPREYKQRGLGSGSIVNKHGYILTNNHVVGEADKITVKLPDGREFEAKLVGADPATDLAVVKIEGKNLPFAKLGQSDDLQVGESVIAIGNPFGLEQTITAGIVSAKGRSSVGLTDYEDFIQTDASINPGNSGGPLVSLRGEVVGVNTAIFSRSGGNQGIGFAIPIKMAREIMTALIDTGKVTRGFLGVVIQDVTPDLAAAMGLPGNGGVLISNVGKGTPAGKGGIRQGDVITTFNERKVKTSNELRNAVAAVKPDTSVPVQLIRGGKPMKVMVKIEEQPEDMRAAISGAPGRGGGRGEERQAAPEAALGLTLRPLTPEIAGQLGYQGLSGVVVIEVEPNSPAAEANLRPRALIREVNRKPVKDVREFRAAYNAVPSGKHLLLLAQLGDFTRYVALKKP